MKLLFLKWKPEQPKRMDELSRVRLSRCVEELRLAQKELEVVREQLALAIDGLHFCAKERDIYGLDARILQARVHLQAIVDLR